MSEKATAAYLRVSSKKQAGSDRHSLDDQERFARAVCEREGLGAPDEAMRGSSGISGFFTTFMTMAPTNEEITELTIAMKGRDLDAPEKMAVTYGGPGDRRFRLSHRDPELERDSADAARIIEREDKIKKGQQAALAALKKNNSPPLPKKVLTAIMRQQGLSYREADDALVLLETSGQVTIVGQKGATIMVKLA